MKPICFLDLETTGTNRDNGYIIEIAIKRVEQKKKDKEYHTYINPGVKIPESATRVHKITDEMVKNSPTLKQVAQEIIEFFDGADIAGFNSNNFDIPFLYVNLQRIGVTWNLEGVNFIDVSRIFTRKEERTLSAAVKFYTGKDHIDAHSAMGDVDATINVFKKQIERYDDLPKDNETLAFFCNYDRKRCDILGCFYIDEDGDHCFSFGKNKGKKCKNNIDYLNWMMSANFSPDTKNFIQLILKSNK